MAKEITKEDVKRIARLANMTLTEKEIETFAPQISSILGYVEKLSELETSGKIFKSQTDLSNVFRKDIPKKSLSNTDATLNRKTTSKDGYIVVKGVLNK
jgi:aspartyl-tRNA(Asn)/glutamyl-tRNA(Gln) amidotransferase subunit C